MHYNAREMQNYNWFASWNKLLVVLYCTQINLKKKQIPNLQEPCKKRAKYYISLYLYFALFQWLGFQIQYLIRR